MTDIDDSTNPQKGSAQTPPGYWFGVIEHGLHARMRDALAEQGMRRGGWRILHTLAAAPATAEEFVNLAHGGRAAIPKDAEDFDFGRGGLRCAFSYHAAMVYDYCRIVNDKNRTQAEKKARRFHRASVFCVP